MLTLYRQGSVVANSIVTYETTSYSSVAAVADAINSTELETTFTQVLSNSSNGTCAVDGLTNFTGCNQIASKMAVASKHVNYDLYGSDCNNNL